MALFYDLVTKADTLCMKHLKDYKISTVEEVEVKIKEFRYKTYKKRPPKKTDKLYQFYDRNDLFTTYIIEVLEGNDKFVISILLFGEISV